MEKYERVLKIAEEIKPEGSVLASDGKCYLGNQELKPRARCSECGDEQRFSDIAAIAAENTFGRKCLHCGQKNTYQLVSFLAPNYKLRRRIEDQLRKNSMGKLVDIAKLLNVPLGN